MATITQRAVANGSAAATSIASGAFTPLAGEKLLAFCATGTSRTAAPTITSTIGGDTFTLIGSVDYSTAGRVHLFVADQGATNSSQTLTFNHDSSNRRFISVAAVDSGVTAVGAALVAQLLTGADAGGTTPSATGSATASGNPLFGGVHTNGDNGGDIVQPSGWTELSDSGGGTGNTRRGETAKLEAGDTASTYTWGGSVSTAWGALIAEIDAGGGGGGVTGTTTQTLPSLEQAASGEETISGSAAQTLPRLSQQASGDTTSLVTGTAAQTLPSLEQAAAGDVTSDTPSGAIAQTLPRLQQALAGSELIAGSIAQILPRLRQLAVGSGGAAAPAGSWTMSTRNKRKSRKMIPHSGILMSG